MNESLWQKIKNRIIGKARRAVLVGFDVLCFAAICLSYYGLNMIFEPHIDYTPKHYIANSGILLLAVLVSRFAFGVYSSVLRYARTFNHLKIVLADAAGACVAVFFTWVCSLYEGMWMFIIIAPVNALLALSSRFVYRLIYKYRRQAEAPDGIENMINVAIVGAGQLGAYLVSELENQGVYNPVMFIDVDPQKNGNKLMGIRIYPQDENVFDIIKKKKVKEIFIALSRLNNDSAQELFDLYSAAECKLKIYDMPVKEFDRSPDSKRTIRSFEIEDLLFREPLSVGDNDSFSYYKEKTVLITGGGGSIGSELCRQIAKLSPKKLIILDIYENNAYDISQELLRKYGSAIDLEVEIASVRDRDRLESIFSNYRPNVVFHAAAHKHVPLMEHSGCEAIKNNVFGTANTADMAEKYGAEKFILISTDKAVNPTNIMGASKRLCEMVIQCRTDSRTNFAAVRFGNVLGSNGSVIPLFKRQIEQGGPVTITDKRIIRYFMTIPEASRLVMQAGAMAQRGELFVLDMGKPIRIYDLAVNMIRLSGYTPGKDIMIEEIGLRPGEKLYEELLMKNEELDSTDNDLIFVEKDAPLSREEMDQKLQLLKEAVERSKNDIGSEIIKGAVVKTVPTYKDPDIVNENAHKSQEMADAEELATV